MASPEEFKCADCGKRFRTRGTYNQHLNTHKKPYSCETCTRGFGLRADLNRHVAARHRLGNQRFPCKVSGCRSMLSRKDNITKHLRHNHPYEYEAQRQKKSNNLEQKSSDTMEANEPSLSEPQATYGTTGAFDWWHSARTGNTQALDSMLRTGFDINSQAGDGNTALHCAVHACQLATVEYLLQNGARHDLRNEKYRTALLEAAVGGSSECILRLLEVNPSICHLSPAWDDWPSFVHHIIRIGDASLVETVLKTKNLTYKTPTLEASSFAVAAAKVGQISILRSLLESNPAALREQNRWLQPPVYYATKHGQIEAVHLLLSPLSRNDRYRPSIEQARALINAASRNGHLQILQMLLKRFPVYHPTQRRRFLTLNQAVLGGQLEIVQYLLSIPEVIANVNLKDHRGHTAVYLAAKTGHIRIVEALLHATYGNAGPETARWSEGEEKPFMAAFWNGHVETCRTLCAYSPSHSHLKEDCLEMSSLEMLARHLLERGLLSIDSRGPYVDGARRKSLLYLAVELNDISLASLVLKHKDWDPEAINDNFASWSRWSTKTVLHIARRKGHTEIAELLIAHGAEEYNQNKGQEGRTHDSSSKPQPSNADQMAEMQEADNSDVDFDFDSDLDD